MTKKILIVDDEPNIVISLEFLMKKEGFEVAVANDGDEALAQVASFNPDLLLLDVMMPKKIRLRGLRSLARRSRTRGPEDRHADRQGARYREWPRVWPSAPMPM
jgi:DNA-binding response OmpR family regulator